MGMKFDLSYMDGLYLRMLRKIFGPKREELTRG
jgi:hypothetical protein